MLTGDDRSCEFILMYDWRWGRRQEVQVSAATFWTALTKSRFGGDCVIAVPSTKHFIYTTHGAYGAFTIHMCTMCCTAIFDMYRARKLGHRLDALFHWWLARVQRCHFRIRSAFECTLCLLLRVTDHGSLLMWLPTVFFFAFFPACMLLGSNVPNAGFRTVGRAMMMTRLLLMQI